MATAHQHIGIMGTSLTTPESPIQKTMSLGQSRTPGKTPTHQTFPRRTPNSASSDLSDGFLYGTPGKTLRQNDLLANLGTIGNECYNILNSLDELSFQSPHMSSPKVSMDDSGLGLSPLSPSFTGSSPRKNSDALFSMLHEPPTCKPGKRVGRLEPLTLSDSPMKGSSTPPHAFACHDPSMTRKMPSADMGSKRELLPSSGSGSTSTSASTSSASSTNSGGSKVASIKIVAPAQRVQNHSYLGVANSLNVPVTSTSYLTSNGDPRAKREKTLISTQGSIPMTGKKTASAAKRGEYRCGKCGFFPKKQKHNCAAERAKRQAAGDFVPGDKGKKSSMPGRASTPHNHHHHHQQEITNNISSTIVPGRNMTMTSDPMLSVYNGSGW